MMAAQQATGTENIARVLGVHLDAMELQVDANAANGVIGNLKKVQSESNMADLGMKVLEKDKIDRHMKNLGRVRFDWYSPGLTVEGEEGCERTPQCDDETTSTLTSTSMSNLLLPTESASARVYNQVQQKQIVSE